MTDLRSDWQKRQAALCSCKGTDDYCPCQNVDFTAPRPTQPSIGMDEREKIAREVLAAEVASGTNETAKRWLAPGGGYGGATVSVRQALRAMHTFAHRLALSATPVDVGEGELPA